jgi:hypothetical protein
MLLLAVLVYRRTEACKRMLKYRLVIKVNNPTPKESLSDIQGCGTVLQSTWWPDEDLSLVGSRCTFSRHAWRHVERFLRDFKILTLILFLRILYKIYKPHCSPPFLVVINNKVRYPGVPSSGNTFPQQQRSRYMYQWRTQTSRSQKGFPKTHWVLSYGTCGDTRSFELSGVSSWPPPVKIRQNFDTNHQSLPPKRLLTYTGGQLEPRWLTMLNRCQNLPSNWKLDPYSIPYCSILNPYSHTIQLEEITDRCPTTASVTLWETPCRNVYIVYRPISHLDR